MTQPFKLVEPSSRTTSVVFASPHSGCDYPTKFLENTHLGPVGIRKSEDAFVDQLYASVPEFGAPLLSAVAPRAYVDLNRGVDELDPAIVEGAKTHGLNPRIASGLGVIPRIVAEGSVIQSGKITMDEAQQRLSQYYHPYHAQLQSMMRETRALFGQAVLIDCHSMPSESLKAAGTWRRIKPDIVLGNRYGASCSDKVFDAIEAAFTGQGFRVARNVPFAGAYVVQTYGRPSINQHTVQVEIDRSLYMDEDAVMPLPEFSEIQARIRGAISELCRFGEMNVPLAAE
jgi:N-formylglutamate deformylase